MENMKETRSRQFPSKISTTTFVKIYILHLLIEKNYYGNEIIDEIKYRMEHKWSPSPGMVYPLLRKLEEDNYIYGWWTEPEKRSIRKYRITNTGLEYYNQLLIINESIFEDSLIIIKNTLNDIYKKKI